MNLIRLAIGRWFIHFGLNIMPIGNSKILITKKLLEAGNQIKLDMFYKGDYS